MKQNYYQMVFNASFFTWLVCLVITFFLHFGFANAAEQRPSEGSVDTPPEVLYQTGINHFYGLQRPVDQKKGAKLIVRAAESGYPVAMVKASAILRGGVGIRRDLSASRKWFRQAEKYTLDIERLAAAGNVEAQMAMNDLYDGFYTKQRHREFAFDWQKTAASSDYLPAKFSFAKDLINNTSVRPDPGKGLLMMEQCAKAGLAGCHLAMAEYYANGIFVEKNIEEAMTRARLASQQGLGGGDYLLAKIFHRAPKYKDIEKAKYWYLRTVERDMKAGKAALELGKIYDAENNEQKAFDYYHMALQRGSNAALALLAKYYLQGRIVKSDLKKALGYLNESASLNYPKAYEILANLYFEGDILQRDLQKTKAYYRKAILKGSPTALVNYMRIYWYWQPDINFDGQVGASDILWGAMRLYCLPGDYLIFRLSQDKIIALTFDLNFDSYGGVAVWVFSTLVWLSVFFFIVLARRFWVRFRQTP